MDKITSGGVKKHCMAAYNWLVKGVKLYLSSPEARDAFMKNRLLSQVHLPDTDMMVEVDREIEHQKFVLLNLTDDTTKGRLTTSFAQQIATAKRKKENFEALLQPAQKPNIAEAITLFLKSPATMKTCSVWRRTRRGSEPIRRSTTSRASWASA